MQMWMILAGVLGFAVFWDLLFRVIAWLTGWRSLARHYRTETPFTGQTWGMQSVRFGALSGYNNAITVGASLEGLYLVPAMFFRSGHAALYIPWAEMASVEDVNEKLFGLPVQGMKVVTKAEPQITLFFTKALSAKIKSEAAA